MLRAVLFDVDGTLIDSNQFHVLAWAEALHLAGHDFRLREIHDQIGQGSDNLLRALLPDISEAEARRLGETHGLLFRDHYAARLKPFPKARELLQRCKQEGLTVILASSASALELELNLNVLDAGDFLDGWTGADDVSHSKPCPDVYQAALRKAGVAPDDAIAVGDTPYDIEGARRAGLVTIALRSGLFDDSRLDGALAIYDDVADLLAQFDSSQLSRVSRQG